MQNSVALWSFVFRDSPAPSLGVFQNNATLKLVSVPSTQRTRVQYSLFWEPY